MKIRDTRAFRIFGAFMMSLLLPFFILWDWIRITAVLNKQAFDWTIAHAQEKSLDVWKMWKDAFK